MILISIQPFAPKKLLALGATIACLSTASCFADAMYLSARSGPVARPVRQVHLQQSAVSAAAREGSVAMASYWAADVIACSK